MILAALQSAAVRLLGQRPNAFFSATGQFEMELSDLINEVAQDVAKYRDWQALLQFATITGDGVATEFTPSADFDRMPSDLVMQDTNTWLWGYQRITDPGAFERLGATGFIGFPGGWTFYGDKLRFAPAPASGSVTTFPYITKNWARPQSGSDKAAFTADTDSFLLPERLLTLGLVWRWRENKKLDASGDQEAFVKALDEYAAKDGGSRVIRQNARRVFAGTYPAWPWELG